MANGCLLALEANTSAAFVCAWLKTECFMTCHCTQIYLDKQGNLMLRVSWLYRQKEVKAASTKFRLEEVMYSRWGLRAPVASVLAKPASIANTARPSGCASCCRHFDDVDAHTVMHPCQVSVVLQHCQDTHSKVDRHQ